MKSPLIVALDKLPRLELFASAAHFTGSGCAFKVEDALYKYGIISVVKPLLKYGQVMVDLKLDKTPDTIAEICSVLHECPPWAVTVHATAGTEGLRRARAALPKETLLLAITVLTSFEEKGYQDVFVLDILQQTKNLAMVANEAGVDGFVCSAEEVSILRQGYPKAILVVPGVRSLGVSHDDQKRVMTPAQAMKNGASHIVMGRQIMNSPDPLLEIQRIQREELGIH